MRSSRLPQLLRGTSSALVATFTALLGHVSAGGAMPGLLGIVVPLVLSSMVSVLLAGRRLSPARLLLAVAASQFLFHELFVLGSVTPVGGLAVHQHGLPAVLPGGEASIAAPAAGMWLAHVLAALLTTAALHRGEVLLTGLVRLAGRLTTWLVAALIGRLPAVTPRPGLRFPVRAADDGALDTGIRFTRLRPRRGPPLPSGI
ncbi:hypothetical protein ACWIDW_10455 [Microbacterium sp. NPDC055312]